MVTTLCFTSAEQVVRRRFPQFERPRGACVLLTIPSTEGLTKCIARLISWTNRRPCANATATDSQGTMQPDPPPILSVRQTSGDLPSQAMFWDGNPEKQSFISIVGLSTPNTRPRPASAPARGSHASAFGSSRQDRPLSCTIEGSAECAAYGERYHHARGERKTSTNQEAGDRVETGRTRVLELRLRQLVRENASMRDALRDIVRETKHEQLAKAQRRELELIGGLQAAKESVDTKATGAPNRVRGPQVYRLRN